MRNREEFKKYVYQKAQEKQGIFKKRRKVFFNMAAAFSLFLIIGGVWLYRGNSAESITTDKKSISETTNEEILIARGVDDGNVPEACNETLALEYSNYGAQSIQENAVLGDSATAVTCSPEEERINVGQFNYYEEYPDGEDIPGVKKGNFKNYSSAGTDSIKDIIDLAKLECTITYDMIDISYDEKNDFWKVVFSTQNTVGGCETVYLNGEGITSLIVYGE